MSTGQQQVTRIGRVVPDWQRIRRRAGVAVKVTCVALFAWWLVVNPVSAGAVLVLVGLGWAGTW